MTPWDIPVRRRLSGTVFIVLQIIQGCHFEYATKLRKRSEKPNIRPMFILICILSDDIRYREKSSLMLS